MLMPESDDMGRYLEMTEIIDFGHDLVKAAAEKLNSETERSMSGALEKADTAGCSGQLTGSFELAYAKTAFEYVRDALPTPLTC
jgi:hypothetical protein